MKLESKIRELTIELESVKKERDKLSDKLRRAEPFLKIDRTPIEIDKFSDFNRTYEEFWKEIVEDDQGRIDFTQVKKELHDYHTCISEVSKVYMHVTGGLISKPNADAGFIIEAFDFSVDEYIQEKLNELEELKHSIGEE